MKRIIALLLVILMTLGFVACEATVPGPASQEGSSGSGSWKIGIMTPSVSQGEEQLRRSEYWVNKLGAEHVIIQMFPDNFTTEQETTISNALSLAADPDVKVIFFYGMIGTAAACQKIREIRPDILLIVGSYNEAAETMTECCDLFYREDMDAMGQQLVARAIETDCKTIVHYSFPRHLANAPMAQRLQVIKELAAPAGIEVVEVTTPDPTSDAGTAGTQQFVLEDVPREIEKYGAQTMFFGTNTAQLEPMVKGCVDGKAYYYPSVESVFTAYPAALGLEVPEDKQWDVPFYVDSIKSKLVELGCEGHMGCWLVSVESFWLDSAMTYAVKYCNGETNGDGVDYDAFYASLNEAAGSEVAYRNITEGERVYENGFFIAEAYEIF